VYDGHSATNYSIKETALAHIGSTDDCYTS